jgi:hypothetical protein
MVAPMLNSMRSTSLQPPAIIATTAATTKDTQA